MYSCTFRFKDSWKLRGREENADFCSWSFPRVQMKTQLKWISHWINTHTLTHTGCEPVNSNMNFFCTSLWFHVPLLWLVRSWRQYRCSLSPLINQDSVSFTVQQLRVSSEFLSEIWVCVKEVIYSTDRGHGCRFSSSWDEFNLNMQKRVGEMSLISDRKQDDQSDTVWVKSADVVVVVNDRLKRSQSQGSDRSTLSAHLLLFLQV